MYASMAANIRALEWVKFAIVKYTEKKTAENKKMWKRNRTNIGKKLSAKRWKITKLFIYLKCTSLKSCCQPLDPI